MKPKLHLVKAPTIIAILAKNNLRFNFMYEAFFKLKIKPFELNPNPDFIFLSRSHKKAVTFIDYGIREKIGFILLTGDIGSGKTTLIRDIMTRRYDRVVPAKIFNTKVTSEQLLAMINDEFGLVTLGKDKITLIRELNSFLIDQYAQDLQPILIIDESQNLSADLLEEVRMLSNLETSNSKLLQIILVGQPELRRTLALPEMLQLRQRIGINCTLKPLNREETEHYISHRLAVAGNAKAVDFSVDALNTIFQFSRGVPRLINIICDFIMLSAFAEETRQISGEMASDVVGELDFDEHYWEGVEDLHSYFEAESSAHDAAVSAISQLNETLRDIDSRLSRIERGALSVEEGGVKEINYRLTELQNAFNYHVGETESLIAELNRKLVHH